MGETRAGIKENWEGWLKRAIVEYGMPSRAESARLTEKMTPGLAPARRAPPLVNVLAVAAGGAVGGSLRYAFIRAFPAEPGAIAWVIFAENISGAFLLGAVLTLLLRRWPFAWDLRPFLTTGVLGSFTTFSNYTLDVALMSAWAWQQAVFYGLLSPVVGLATAAAGVAAARSWSTAA